MREALLVKLLLQLFQATEEEQAAIRAMLSKRAESAPADAAVNRASAWAWAGLKLAAAVLLAAGVVVGFSDGDEFDDVGCSVAQQPGGTSHGAHSAKTRERADGKLPGSVGGSAGSSDGGGPYGGKADPSSPGFDAARRGKGNTEGKDPTSNIRHRTLNVERGEAGTRLRVASARQEAETLKAETFPVKLLKQVLASTPEQQAVIERLLMGHAFPDRQPSAPPGSGTSGVALLAPQPGHQRRHALQKGQGAWALTHDGAPAVFVDRAGMDFVNYLLKHPGEPIHSLELLARVQGEAPVQQRSAALDDGEATKDYLREMSRLRELIESEDASHQEKEVAKEELAQLEASLPDIHHRTIDEAFKKAKSVRQAIRRVCLSLAEAQDEQHCRHPVLTAFAAHLQKHLLGPSQPGSVPAGHLVYEPPDGVAWA